MGGMLLGRLSSRGGRLLSLGARGCGEIVKGEVKESGAIGRRRSGAGHLDVGRLFFCLLRFAARGCIAERFLGGVRLVPLIGE